MRYLRSATVAILLAISAGIDPACATSFSPDQSDLWWVPTESGWGMQLVQRDTVIFATMFIYDTSNNPVWYTATLSYVPNTLKWSGPLLLTHGPAFSTVPFDPNQVTRTNVGTMTWTASPIVTSGHLDYSINGTNVSKDMIRQTLAFDNFNGSYIGGSTATTTNCTDPSGNRSTQSFVTTIFTQTGSAIAASSQSGSVTCNYQGTYGQSGQMGNAAGSYSCSDGDAGTFTFLDMQVSISSFTSRFVTTSSMLGCQTTGVSSGTRR